MKSIKVGEKGIVWIKREDVIQMIEELIEPLSELEHEQWVSWTKYIADNYPGIPASLITKWEKSGYPYKDLKDEVKEHDRVWARKVIKLLLKPLKEGK